MKTKTKILALLEIAIVLCSLFLVALPAIAGEQTSQKAGATITTASEDDYVLDIYGNANEDDTIDMRDLTYVKLIFFGKKPETELADAKYDGKINPLDFIQIKLIIVGKEKEITVIDSAERTVTVKKPVERIVSLIDFTLEAIVILNANDRVVGIDKFSKKNNILFPELSKLPSVGVFYAPDIEAILELNPDIVCAITAWPSKDKLEGKLPETIPVIRLDFWRAKTLREEMEKMGYILDEEENADKYLEWHDKYVNLVKEKVSEISEDNKERVFIDASGGKVFGRRTRSTGDGAHQLCVMAGGKNIAEGYVKGSPDVETEWILKQNPDVIVGLTIGRGGGYETNDVTKMKAHYDEIIGLPGFREVKAVKNNKVYIMANTFAFAPHYPAALAMMAKWFYPDEFEDLDPQATHQEYVDEFLDIDFDVKEHGTFVYHPELYPDGR